ncbi:hypothetical protein [Kamptonema sp. UHCC 0994]|uniref:hypothetical protein n=1 Tax=Kamptonema sp. UHCC 0994 TaxID=3031329 RepID=UPI0023B8EEF2|nr:hypothetical protein [Kamptonema sp. UHCC 0994]MDF0555198.1 hypothetical protein [Kamptonema sp. UHCC 0994]
MIPIREIAQQALTTGHLTVEAEKLIGQLLLSASYSLEDLNAYMSLQLAAMAGRVKQESLELVQANYMSFQVS